MDAYAAQHPGTDGTRERQSVALHLIGLHLALELKSPSELRPGQLGRLAVKAKAWPWLIPPVTAGGLDVLQVFEAGVEKRPELIEAWAKEIWQAWAIHQPLVRRWWQEWGS